MAVVATNTGTGTCFWPTHAQTALETAVPARSSIMPALLQLKIEQKGLNQG